MTARTPLKGLFQQDTSSPSNTKNTLKKSREVECSTPIPLKAKRMKMSTTIEEENMSQLLTGDEPGIFKEILF